MKIAISRLSPRWLPGLCLTLALAVFAPRLSAAPKDIVVPLNEPLLAHLEKTATGLTAREQADRALKKDFEACQKDKKITGDTSDAMSASIAARHPRVAAALAAEGWKAGDFYVAYLTVAAMPFLSDLSHGGIPDDNKVARQSIAFYDKRKTRVMAVIRKLGPLTAMAENME